MSEALFTIEPIRFTVAAPDSKKNRGQIVRFDNRVSYRPNPVALEQEQAIRDYLELRLGSERPHFDNHDVRVSVDYLPRSDELDVLVEDVRPKPKGFTGRKRDLANLIEVLLDAMQGPVFANDNQVAEIWMARKVGA